MKASKSRTEKVVTALLLTTVETFMGSFWLMLLLGAAHSQERQVPAFSYVTCLLLVVAIGQLPLKLADSAEKNIADEVRAKLRGGS